MHTERQVAIDAAQSVAIDLTTVNATNAAEHMDALSQQSAGDFHDEVSKYAAIYGRVLEAGKVTSQGHVTAVGVERLDADQATILLTVSSDVTNSQLASSQRREYRLALRLQHTDGRWLTTNVDYVG
jgi:Mce-associated membrane protein